MRREISTEAKLPAMSASHRLQILLREQTGNLHSEYRTTARQAHIEAYGEGAGEGGERAGKGEEAPVLKEHDIIALI